MYRYWYTHVIQTFDKSKPTYKARLALLDKYLINIKGQNTRSREILITQPFRVHPTGFHFLHGAPRKLRLKVNLIQTCYRCNFRGAPCKKWNPVGCTRKGCVIKIFREPVFFFEIFFLKRQVLSYMYKYMQSILVMSKYGQGCRGFPVLYEAGGVQVINNQWGLSYKQLVGFEL